jgi:hypothetical protein
LAFRKHASPGLLAQPGDGDFGAPRAVRAVR